MDGWNRNPMRGLGALALVLVSHAAWSTEAKPTLEERRLSVIKGTTPGIVILDWAVPGALSRRHPPTPRQGRRQPVTKQPQHVGCRSG